MIQDSIEYKIDNSLSKTIGELRLSVLYSELKELNYWKPNSIYYDYASELPITPCSNRIAVSVSGKY